MIKEFNMKKISFIISNYNTKDYTKLCYDSIRQNLSHDHEIVLLSDASVDGTNELLYDIEKNDKNVKVYINSESQIGIAYMYNKGVELASNEVVCVLHSDMVIPPNFDERMLFHQNSGIEFLTAFRVEPPLYPESGDKYQENFGLTWDTFDMKKFIQFSESNYVKNKSKTQRRTCFPWMTTKTIYNSVGGNDTLFLKYMVDDDDFYYRIMSHGYRYEQVLDTCVYHFCSRSTKFENDDVSSKGSNKWNYQYMKSTRNFIRKWGFPQNEVYSPDMSLKSMPSFKKCLILPDINDINFIAQVEPFYDKIVFEVDSSENYNKSMVDEYINQEQKNTLISLSDKFFPNSYNEDEYTLIVKLTNPNITNEIFNVLISLYAEIDENSDPGEYMSNDMILTINKFKDMTSLKKINNRIFDKYE